ncbi:hypothetical protein ACQ4PT_042845 [Festuca glaucescens]
MMGIDLNTVEEDEKEGGPVAEPPRGFMATSSTSGKRRAWDPRCRPTCPAASSTSIYMQMLRRTRCRRRSCWSSTEEGKRRMWDGDNNSLISWSRRSARIPLRRQLQYAAHHCPHQAEDLQGAWPEQAQRTGDIDEEEAAHKDVHTVKSLRETFQHATSCLLFGLICVCKDDEHKGEGPEEGGRAGGGRGYCASWPSPSACLSLHVLLIDKDGFTLKQVTSILLPIFLVLVLFRLEE